MKIIDQILKNPIAWSLSQLIFGDDKQKMNLYRSVIQGGGKILDFGCANGNTFPAFYNLEYYGFDNDLSMIVSAKRKYKYFKNAHFYKIDILENNSPVNGFDHVLFALTGHHLDDESLIKIFYKLSELLKKGGKLYYFDSVKNPQKDSLLLTILINLDQGKYIRTKSYYQKIKKLLPKQLKMRESRFYQVKGTLMPQPEYVFWKLEKIK